ncbi:CocE/NonD family hydrolase [Gluconobacter wancherniae]|uniref:Glutaryl-7-ACA acylase n=1 Tax=Gluconobacter wancherniae NBRC 103581 TaxID=656744 RepID=A0A511AYY2_9PROT|nr:CocE/NonD family hydrolase [Gluconobacter wancherniae]MBS1094037.1 CocE/NonD family hydrolase [Gluconobacter wancherniae]GBD55707.1 glutaryl-7-ACA acylase [Gluconobacter wancherniae NBRC 103581]GBR66274.1 alpha-amino acid ester hydrolase [Gluconobacter wancherniae NBRC 103581]GEK93386.1 glutaryl-7-ACA acylase [Gluconobacter wancherniae NBRC 103581]
MNRILLSFSTAIAAFCMNAANAQSTGPDTLQTGSDIPAHVSMPTDARDYIKRDVMIPMRDGVKLHTVIAIPKNAHQAPILLTRTPYHASERLNRIPNAPSIRSISPQGDGVFIEEGYIRVFQDVRGKYGSEGNYVMTRPPIGPLNTSKTDDTTDAWDTIDWLVKNVPESNGRVGMTGSSYEGWTVVMALLDPHPALKVAAPESPMVDGWMGDDWFHYGAYRQTSFDYFTAQMSGAGSGDGIPRDQADDYTTFLQDVSAGNFATKSGLDQFPWWRRMKAHPAYDAFWQDQALDHLITKHPLKVPTIWEQGLWDQEDMWGAIHSWQALRNRHPQVPNILVMGPWRHSGVNYDGSTLGPLHFDGDTALWYRANVMRPFFDHYLKDAPDPHFDEAIIYNTGENHWDHFRNWLEGCGDTCAMTGERLYLQPGNSLSFKRTLPGSDSYVSDPAHPVPFLPRPYSMSDSARWKPWLVADQRFAESRPDVLTYETPVLDQPVRVSGVPTADLFASTTGTDADWVVKIIDVMPGVTADRPEMGGYELPMSMDIFRGRYRSDFAHPSAIPAGQVQEYKFTLPAMNHVFQKGHRIMVQIQSTWFPLYDRNPQTFVPNIFNAKASDFHIATQTIYRGGNNASAVWLPVVK